MKIVKYIGARTVEESNDFLRKLWGELDEIRKNGWCYIPHTDTQEKRIQIGNNSFGEIEIDYEQKGCIENIYFDVKKEEDIKLVEEALAKAKEAKPKQIYYVILKYPAIAEICIAKRYKHNVGISSDDKYIYISFQMLAYSESDLKFWVIQKWESIRYIFYVFTHQILVTEKYEYTYTAELVEFVDSAPIVYDYQWFDADECPVDGGLLLPDEFFDLVNKVVKHDFFPKKISHIIDASQHLFSAQELATLCLQTTRFNRTGFVDIANTLIVSAIEAISMLEVADYEMCKCCGQMKYKISQRVSDIMEKYLGDVYRDDMKRRLYPSRSKFLHEGGMMTPLYFTGRVYPLIDICDKRTMLNMLSHVEFNYLDYCGYVIRKMIASHIAEIED